MNKAMRHIMFEQVQKSEINPEDRVLTDQELEKLDSMARIHCSNMEMAHALGFGGLGRWLQFLSVNERVADRVRKLRAEGAIALRTAQFKSALEGNPAMQMWLGKTILGQNDQLTMLRDEGNPNPEPLPLSDISPDTRKRLADMAKSIYQPKEIEGELTPVNSEMSSDTPGRTEADSEKGSNTPGDPLASSTNRGPLGERRK